MTRKGFWDGLVLGLLLAALLFVAMGCDTYHVAEVCVPLDSIVGYETAEDSTVFKAVVYKTPCN